MSQRRHRSATKASSAPDSGRNPWFTCAARSRRFSPGARDRSTSSRATESAPPETAAKTTSPPRSIAWRRMVASARSERLLPMVTLQPDPHLAVLEVLLLPDRHRLLERVDREAARLEGFPAMRGGHRDEHARLTDLEAADAVDEGELADAREPRAGRHGDLAHLRQRHRRMRLVLEELHAAPARLIPHHAGEEDDRPRAGVFHRGHEGGLGEGRLGELHEVGGPGGPAAAAAHRWEQAELLAGTERAVGLHVILIDGEQRER